jgi:hypothetical protein
MTISGPGRRSKIGQSNESSDASRCSGCHSSVARACCRKARLSRSVLSSPGWGNGADWRRLLLRATSSCKLPALRIRGTDLSLEFVFLSCERFCFFAGGPPGAGSSPAVRFGFILRIALRRILSRMLRSVGIVQQKSQELQKAMRDGFQTTNHARPLCILAVGCVRNNNYDQALERKNKGQEADLHMRRDKDDCTVSAEASHVPLESQSCHPIGIT